MSTFNRDIAWNILNDHMKTPYLIKHSLAAEAAMQGLAEHFGEDKESWGIVGLMHDADYEQTKDTITDHTEVAAKWLTEAGATDDIISAIRSHAYSHTGKNPPVTKMEWAIFCCDELTGLIVAAALVSPEKKLKNLTVESVLKRFKSPSFAAKVNRESIGKSEKELGIKLPEFIEVVLDSMKRISNKLDL